MIVTYVKHSCFSVELDRHVLLFDYFNEGELPKWNRDKEILVFASHKHADHFHLGIFKLAEQYPRIHFFLGAGVRLSSNYLIRNQITIDKDMYVTNLSKRQEYLYHDVKVRTLRSTDMGVAFLIQCEGKAFYHAGDLNCWVWKGETDACNQKMQKAYEAEIDSIKGMYFDCAFVPLDPRQEEYYWMGMEYFMKNVSAAHVFPMHMWEEYEYIDSFINERASEYRDCVMRITASNQIFTVKE